MRSECFLCGLVVSALHLTSREREIERDSDLTTIDFFFNFYSQLSCFGIITIFIFMMINLINCLIFYLLFLYRPTIPNRLEFGGERPSIFGKRSIAVIISALSCSQSLCDNAPGWTISTEY